VSRLKRMPHHAVRNVPHPPCGRRLRASMKSTQTLCATLMIFLAVVFQCHISAAQGVIVTQTGRETIESYDSATERLTISAEYRFQWQPSDRVRSFSAPVGLIGEVSFSSGGTGVCTQFNPRLIKCPPGITSATISYQYWKRIFASEDGQERFNYESGFGFLRWTPLSRPI
jgi:hypothetical protein